MFIETYVCPNCWKRRDIAAHCPECGPRPPIGYYRFPPVDPVTGDVSANNDAILMGNLQHRVLPEQHRKTDCVAIMNDHGWIGDGTPLGVVFCPPWGSVDYDLNAVEREGYWGQPDDRDKDGYLIT